MSMEDSAIKMVRVDQMLLIGSLEAFKLVSPRVIGQIPSPAGPPQLVLLELVGSPKEITLPQNIITWEPKDDALVNAYRENVTGLMIAKTMPVLGDAARKSNVLPIGGKGN